MEQYKLGKRELISILILAIGTKFTDYTPDLFFPQGMMATWMIPLVAAFFTIVPLFIVVHLIAKYEVGIVELSNILLGKYMGALVGLFIFLFMLLSTGILLHNYANILTVLYYPQTSIELFVLLLVFTCFLIAFLGPYVIGRTAWIITPYVKIAIGLLLILTFTTQTQISTQNLYPLFGKGLDIIAKESFFKSAIFCEFIVFAGLIPFVKKAKDYKTAALVSLGITAIEMAAFFLIYIIVFDAYSLVNMSLPFQNLTRAVQLGRFITNFEVYFLAFWLCASLIKYAIYLYITTLYFTQTFNLKKTRPHLFPIAVLVLLIAVVPENVIGSYLVSRSYTLYVGSVFFILLPFVLLMFTFRKKVRMK